MVDTVDDSTTPALAFDSFDIGEHGPYVPVGACTELSHDSARFGGSVPRVRVLLRRGDAMKGINKTTMRAMASDASEMLGPDDVETSVDVERELDRVEQDLARALGIQGKKYVRRELIAIVRRGERSGDPQLERWLELYTTHLYWARRECAEDEPPFAEKATVEAPEKAAEAAFGLLWSRLPACPCRRSSPHGSSDSIQG